MKLKHLFIGILTILYSCSPMTKESYLNSYKDFISDISAESSDFTDSDWQEAETEFYKFRSEWRKKFEDELIWKDQIVLAKYEVQYNLHRYRGSVSDIINDVFGTYNELEEKVKYYAENKMTDDIDFLIEQANEIGGSATEMLSQILIDLDVEYQAGYNVRLKVTNNKNEK